MSVYVVVRVDGTEEPIEALSRMQSMVKAGNTWDREVICTAVAATGVKPSVHAPSVVTDEWRDR